MFSPTWFSFDGVCSSRGRNDVRLAWLGRGHNEKRCDEAEGAGNEQGRKMGRKFRPRAPGPEGVGRLQMSLLKSIIRSPEYLSAGRCQRRFESFSEVVRCEKLHHFAQVLGFGGPKRDFEAPLGGLPQGIRFTELGPSQGGQTDQPVAPVLRIDSDGDQLFAGERLQGVSKTAGVHHQRIGQRADRRRLGTPDFRQYRALRRLQAARRERRIVKLRDSSRRLSQFRAMAAPFAFGSCGPGSLVHVMVSVLICKHMLVSAETQAYAGIYSSSAQMQFMTLFSLHPDKGETPAPADLREAEFEMIRCLYPAGLVQQ